MLFLQRICRYQVSCNQLSRLLSTSPHHGSPMDTPLLPCVDAMARLEVTGRGKHQPMTLTPISRVTCASESIAALKLSSSDAATKEYQCPSRLLEHFSQLVILEPALNKAPSYELPVTVHHPLIAPNLHDTEVVEPPLNDNVNEESRAKYCKYGMLEIRRLKMKKHRKRQLLKKFYFVWKKQHEKKEATLMMIHKKELSEMQKKADDFDAKKYVQDQLYKARRGGYYVNVFSSKEK